MNDILIANTYEYANSVLVSFDNAASWKPFNEGLFFGGTKEITHDDTYLYAATTGQGVFRRKISDLYTTSTHSISANQEISIFPNPSNGNFTLKLDSNLSGDANLVITDLNGKVCLNRNIILNPEIKVEAETLSSGLYLLSLRSGESSNTGKIVIQK